MSDDMYTLTLSGDELRSIIRVEGNDFDFIEASALDKIRSVLCDGNHVESMESRPASYSPYGVFREWKPLQYFAHCAKCLESLWSIRPADYERHTYWFTGDSSDHKRVMFKPGDENDPHKDVKYVQEPA